MAIKNEIMSREELGNYFKEHGRVAESDLENVLDAVDEINRLKKEKNAVILAHYYMRDELKLGIADYIGDSLDLSKEAKATDADLIVFCGVHFMAETAKILNSQKKVLLPNLGAGCSLAESITAEQVRDLRKQYPDAAFATYINTTAEVKAEVDVCVTSANAPKIIAELPQKQVVFLPDAYMGANLKTEIPDKEILIWEGTCVVHETFSPYDIIQARLENPDVKVLAHYECHPDVLRDADMHGGTSDMIRYIEGTDAPAYVLATECGLAGTIKKQFPDKELIGPCQMCTYMKMINIYNTLDTLRTEQPEITVPEDIRVKAERSLDKMLELSK
jgi:quinolinate synthase